MRASPLGYEEPMMGSPRETLFPRHPLSHFGYRMSGWSDDRFSLYPAQAVSVTFL